MAQAERREAPLLKSLFASRLAGDLSILSVAGIEELNGRHAIGLHFNATA